MNSKAYISGFIFGLMIVAIACTIWRIVRREKRAEYDERQEAIRGKGFKLAYFTAIIVLILGGCVEMLLDAAWCGLFSFAMLALWLSVCVFATYCVVRDAYFTLRSKRSLLIVIAFAGSAINLFIGIRSIAAGELMAGGVLSLNAVNLLTGACCLYLGAMMLCRSLWERRREEME